MKTPPNYIQVWSWEDAPEELQALSDHGGDEDWVALLPPKYVGQRINWITSRGPFGYCAVGSYTHPNFPGYEIRIGAHA